MSSSNVAVSQGPAYSQVALLSNIPDGAYMVTAQINVADSVGDTDARCHVSVDGSQLTGTDTVFATKDDVGTATIASADTLSGGGSSVSVECSSGDNTLTASVNLALVRVDALN